MNMIVFCWLVLISASVIKGFCSNGVINNGFVLRKSAFQYFLRSTIFTCASECVMHKFCRSFSFQLASKTCHLSYNTSSDRGNMESDVDFIQSDINNWPQAVAGPCAEHSCPSSSRCVVHRRSTSCRPVPFVNVEEDLSTVYEFEPTRMTWPLAKEDCVRRGGQLAIVEDEIENDFLNKIITELGHPNSLIWFGATDEAVEGTWMWIDGSPIVYTAWMSGQPNNPGEQDCAGVIPSMGWKSNPCGYDYRFLCERKVIQSDLSPTTFVSLR